MADVSDIISYYVNLLIIQYHNQPKAMATIRLFAEVMNASGVIFDVQDGYNLDTAVGVQLDVLGKYAGVTRFYDIIDLIDPDAEQKYGFCDYATYDDPSYNGTLNYQSFLSTTNRLNDDDYRTIIRLKILENNINYSHGAIDNGIYSIFGDDVQPSSDGDMKMWYIVTANSPAVIQAALAKNLLPHPMGVSIALITNVTEPFFGFAIYGDGPDNAEYSANILGFTDYVDYDTSNGNTLTYDNISV